ncbi:hypothetical protein LWI28_028738 [Acer negundo]|uniref:Magnesium transporter n=1 Tax=Acer negundo TaxID=4023 RepID=A0AAD5J3M2_ACENE|nr:hypothetical protein LWI28_028738 [Acer negundo]
MVRDGVVVPAVDHDQSCLNKKTAASRSWILLDHNGHNAILDVDKYVIMRRFQIHAREHRFLDPMFSYPSTILDVEFPFEFRALEVALEAICSYLDACTRELETDAYPALEQLISKISCHNLDRVRKLKRTMTRLTNRVQKVRDELEQILDDDDDMADLYLSRKLTVASLPVSGSGAPDWFPNSPAIGSKISQASRASAAAATQEENDAEELEMLLEAHYTQIDGTLNNMDVNFSST